MYNVDHEKAKRHNNQANVIYSSIHLPRFKSTYFETIYAIYFCQNKMQN